MSLLSKKCKWSLSWLLLLPVDSFLYSPPTLYAGFAATGENLAAMTSFLAHGVAHIIAFVGYEHILTLADEYTLLFKNKWTGTTWLFLVNRYA